MISLIPPTNKIIEKINLTTFSGNILSNNAPATPPKSTPIPTFIKRLVFILPEKTYKQELTIDKGKISARHVA